MNKEPEILELQESMSNEAAVNGLLKEKSVDMIYDKSFYTTRLRVLILVFGLLYLAAMIGITYWKYQQNLKLYEEHVIAVGDYIAENLGEDMIACVHGIYAMEEAENQYQQFTAEIYDEKGNCVASTDYYLGMKLLSAQKEYFPLEEYLSESELKGLCEVDANQSYMITVQIDYATKQLLSIKLEDYSEDAKTRTVWEWQNEVIKYVAEENIISYQGYNVLQDVLLIPEQTTSTNSSKHEREVEFNGENYQIVVYSSGEALEDTMDSLAVVYVLGFLGVTMLIGVTYCIIKRVRERSCRIKS